MLADSVVRTNGHSYNDVEVVSARHDSVLFKVRGETQTLPADEVERVERESAWLARPRALYDAGKFKSAALGFSKVQGGKPWEKAEASYYVGLCLLQLGDSARAKAAFTKYLSGHREEKDWWVPYAIWGLGQAALKAGQGSTARSHFSELSSFGKNWTRRADMGNAEALRLSKKYVDARNLFNKIITDRRAPLALRQQAMVGYGETLLAQGQNKQLADRLNGWFFKGARPGEILYSEARARATILMARSLASEGGKAKLEEAEIWYLKVIAVYGDYPAEAKAAARELVDVYTKLGRKDRASEWKRRSGTGGNGK